MQLPFISVTSKVNIRIKNKITFLFGKLFSQPCLQIKHKMVIYNNKGLCVYKGLIGGILRWKF